MLQFSGLRDFEVRHQPWDYYAHGIAKNFTDLLIATKSNNPNFVLTNGGIRNAWGSRDWYDFYGKSINYPKYNPERVIKAGELPPIHIPWNIGLGQSNAHLVFTCPTEKPMLFRRNLGFGRVELGLGSHYDYNGQHHENSRLIVTWPWFFKVVAKFLAVCRNSKYRNCLNRQGIDLIALTDQPTPEPKN